MSLLSAHGLVKAYGPKEVLGGVSVTVEDGDRIGLVGRNGAGKSTLVRILGGDEDPDGGELIRRRGLRVRTVAQAPTFPADRTVGEAVLDGLAHHQAVRRALESVADAIDSGEALDHHVERQAELAGALERAGGWNVEHLADAVMDALGTPPKDRRLDSLSIGEQRRVALAVGLLDQPDILILDEPTNHLDVGTIEWLETRLLDYPGALVLVTHDRYFLDRVANRLAEIDRGELHLYEGNYTEYMVKKAEREAMEARTERNRQRAIEQELTWVRRAAPARTTKQKARLERFDQLVAARPVQAAGDVVFRLPHPPRIGKTILEVAGLTKRAGDRLLFEDLDLVLKRNDRIGIVGPNGAGKTTFLRTILGEVKPDAGTVVQGKNTTIVYADQGRTVLDEDQTVLENVAGKNDRVFLGEEAISVHAFLEQLLFDGAMQRTRVGALSGGEKSRVALAKCLRRAGNLLILDEPTNDLDLATLRVLEEALERYPGCALIVSHDRYFLDRIATAILAFEGDGRVVLYEGGHTTYRARAKSTEPAKTERAKKDRTSGPKRPRTRRSFAEEKELGTIESRIMEAEATVQAIEVRMSDPEEIKRLGPKVQEEVARSGAAQGRDRRGLSAMGSAPRARAVRGMRSGRGDFCGRRSGHLCRPSRSITPSRTSRSTGFVR